MSKGSRVVAETLNCQEPGANVSIRGMSISDVDDVAKLLTAVGLCKPADAANRIRRLHGRHQETCFVAECNQELVGVVLAVYTGFHVWITHVAVANGKRGTGVGQALHEKLLRTARGLGAAGIVVDSWLSSVGFYYRLGYRTPGAVFLIKDI